jgi:CheY-like chemotaxis protein
MNASITETELHTPNTPALSTIPDVSHPGKRILIVQSSHKTPTGIASRLSACGHDITVRDAASAHAAALQNSPDLLLLDISASPDEGFALAAHIQESIRWRVPVLFLAPVILPHFQAKGEEVNAVGFLENACASERLMAAVELALAE